MKKLEKQEAKLRVCIMTLDPISIPTDKIIRPKLRNALEETFTKVPNCSTSTRSRYEYDFTHCIEQHLISSLANIRGDVHEDQPSRGCSCVQEQVEGHPSSVH